MSSSVQNYDSEWALIFMQDSLRYHPPPPHTHTQTHTSSHIPSALGELTKLAGFLCETVGALSGWFFMQLLLFLLRNNRT